MNARETGCWGVAAALALSALAGDATAEEVAVSHAPVSPAARARSAPLTHTTSRARPRAAMSVAIQPELARSAALPGTLGAGLLPLTPPVLPPVVTPAGSGAAMRTGSNPADRQLREVHLSEAPAVPAAGSPPATSTDEETPADSPDSEAALDVAERLLGNGVPLQLLQSVIVPAARGVTIAEIQTEGAGAVTLSVRPTKITRGSGLVAVGRF